MSNYRQNFKTISPLAAIRQIQERNTALKRLWDESVQVQNDYGKYQDFCGGWDKALSNPYNLYFANWNKLREIYQTLSRHFSLPNVMERKTPKMYSLKARIKTITKSAF